MGLATHPPNLVFSHSIKGHRISIKSFEDSCKNALCRLVYRYYTIFEGGSPKSQFYVQSIAMVAVFLVFLFALFLTRLIDEP